MVDNIKNSSFAVSSYKRRKKKLNLSLFHRPFIPVGIEWKKDGFGDEVEAWVGGAQRQTSTTADKHGSVSEGEGVGGDEERERGIRGREG